MLPNVSAFSDGEQLNITQDHSSLNFIENNSFFLFHETEWVFSFWEDFFFYNYKIVSYLFWNYLYNDLVNLNQKIYWNNPNLNFQFDLFLAFIVDKIYFLSVLSLPYFNDFFKHFLNSSEFNNFFYVHPEFYLIFKDYLFYFYNNYMSSMYTSLYLLSFTESYISIVMVFVQFLILLFLFLLFLITYFCYFINSSNSDNIIDHDYLLFNVLVEAEEEIGSIDDMLLTSVVLIYIFFWFFWINSVTSVMIISSSLIMTISLFPFLYFLILFIPFSLLYDYGSYFLTYLNGVGKSFIALIELLFDYIATSIFFLRLTVQNVRLAFMLFTYVELHEMIIFNSFMKNIMIGNDSYADVANESIFWLSVNSFFLVLSLPIRILNWLYELFHTFFMLIFQFVAFFAMIFWLFLFLYTMFISEIQEGYFTVKRQLRHNMYKNWFLFKKV